MGEPGGAAAGAEDDEVGLKAVGHVYEVRGDVAVLDKALGTAPVVGGLRHEFVQCGLEFELLFEGLGDVAAGVFEDVTEVDFGSIVLSKGECDRGFSGGIGAEVCGEDDGIEGEGTLRRFTRLGADGEDGALGVTDDSFRTGTEHGLGEAVARVGASDDEVRLNLVGETDDRSSGIAALEFVGDGTDTFEAEIGEDAFEVLAAGATLIVGGHPDDGFLGACGGRQLDNVGEGEGGREPSGETFGVGGRGLGGGGKVGG